LQENRVRLPELVDEPDHMPVLARQTVRQRIENRVEVEGREEAEDDVAYVRYDCDGKRVREEWSRLDARWASGALKQ